MPHIQNGVCVYGRECRRCNPPKTTTCNRCNKSLEILETGGWSGGMYVALEGFYEGFIDNASPNAERDLHRLCHRCSHTLAKFLGIDDRNIKLTHAHNGKSWCNGYTKEEFAILYESQMAQIKAWSN